MRCLPSCRAHLHEAGRLGQLWGPVGDKGGGKALTGHIPQQRLASEVRQGAVGAAVTAPRRTAGAARLL